MMLCVKRNKKIWQGSELGTTPACDLPGPSSVAKSYSISKTAVFRLALNVYLADCFIQIWQPRDLTLAKLM